MKMMYFIIKQIINLINFNQFYTDSCVILRYIEKQKIFLKQKLQQNHIVLFIFLEAAL